MRPIGPFVLTREIGTDGVSVNGVVLPDGHGMQSKRYEVLELGTGGVNDDGVPFEFTVSVGDIAILNEKPRLITTNVNGEKRIQIDYRDIIAVVGRTDG